MISTKSVMSRAAALLWFNIRWRTFPSQFSKKLTCAPEFFIQYIRYNNRKMAKLWKRLMIQLMWPVGCLLFVSYKIFWAKHNFKTGFIVNSCFPLHRDLHRYSNAALFIRQTLDTRQFPLHPPRWCPLHCDARQPLKLLDTGHTLRKLDAG